MKIIDLLHSGKPTLSFEVFPPKTEDKFASVESVTKEIAALKPDFMSVTYGAGGGTSQFTVDLADKLQREYGVPILGHLTCVSSTHDQVHQMLDTLQTRGIENVLALRGDIPEDGGKNEYHYASELIREIKNYGDFCIGAACYPEGHIESKDKANDLKHLKEKCDEGVDFLTTQMFFDNAILYRFLYRIREIGILQPVCAGIMPVTNGKQMKRIGGLSGTELPQRFKAILDKFGSNPRAMKQAGIAYATDQIIDLLANGVTHIHVYTMNKPDIAAAIMKNLSEILKV